jgi:tripartite-type tricarboxylate transporter receptor subunit TctC
MRDNPILITAVICLAGLGLASTAAPAQTFPERPIRLVVPFPPGGATDTTARLVAQAITRKLGQPVIIENQGGAGGTIGARQVVGAAADGYTLLMGAVSSFGTQPLLYRLDYEPIRAFTPVATVAVDKGVLVVNPSLPVATAPELVAYAKANPGKLNYGSAIGIGPHFVAEMFKLKTGADIVHVPYRGGAPMISDLIGGQIQMTVNGKSVLLPHIQAGKVRALAVSGAERWPEFADVPTLVELGYMDAPYDTVFGVMAPAGTPAATVEKLNAAINEGLALPEIRASFARLGIDPKITSVRAFADLVAEEVPKWAAIVRATGIKVE